MSEQSIQTLITINDREINAVVKFDYSPAEPRSFDDPGCDEEVTINSIKVSGQEVPNWLFDLIYADMEAAVLEEKENQKAERQADYDDHHEEILWARWVA